jgi:hypothetical protein
LRPKYISLKINGYTQQDRRTEANAIRFRIKAWFGVNKT